MQTTMIIFGLAIMAFGLLLFRSYKKMKNTPLVPDNEKILVLTDKNFQHQTKGKTVLVDFWAQWCGPCRMMAPILNDLANEINGNTKIGKVNIEQYQSLAQKFKVRSIPTMILFNDGKEMKRFVGVKSKEFLMTQIKNS